METKPGYQTTEFIALMTTIVGAILTGLVIAGYIGEAEKEVIMTGIVALVGLVGVVVAAVRRYTESRTRVKEAASKAAVVATLQEVKQGS